jgi:hypothetical protein
MRALNSHRIQTTTNGISTPDYLKQLATSRQYGNLFWPLGCGLEKRQRSSEYNRALFLAILARLGSMWCGRRRLRALVRR